MGSWVPPHLLHWRMTWLRYKRIHDHINKINTLLEISPKSPNRTAQADQIVIWQASMCSCTLNLVVLINHSVYSDICDVKTFLGQQKEWNKKVVFFFFLLVFQFYSAQTNLAVCAAAALEPCCLPVRGLAHAHLIFGMCKLLEISFDNAVEQFKVSHFM